jgi:hypothetical protein
MPDRLAILTDALAFSRTYTLSLLDTIPQADWFMMPAGCPSHIAWQVGHLALAEARLVYDRVCGGHSQDGLLPPEFHTLFGRTSVPDPDAAKHPSAAEIRTVFDRVHEATLQALRDVSDAQLDEVAIGPAHRLCRTKVEFLRWAGHHEMTHAGQIGLIRRMLGQSPVW